MYNPIQFYSLISLLLLLSCNTEKHENKQKTPDSTVSAKILEKPDSILYKDMVSFEGGTFLMGSVNGTSFEQPVHQVTISPFKLDISPVTVKSFAAFVQATGYKTDAERFGDSGVFNFTTQQWELKQGAYWKFPLGPGKEAAPSDHPVTHISWNDAKAYCEWAGKRLPSEAEWEYAAKNGGKSVERYSWGNELTKNGKYMANTWEGANTSKKIMDDGFLYTSPVGHYGKTASGLTDMGGNVWNWCEDTYEPYPGNKEPFQYSQETKIIRGGSFFYDQNGELSYTTTFRGFNTSETSLFNIGFRCAAN